VGLALSADRDGLTGLRRFDALEEALQGRPRWALFVDVDGLIWMNDARGALETDQALRRVAGVLAARADACSGLAARVGGDEFILVLPEASQAEAVQLGAALRADVARLAICVTPDGLAPGLWRGPFAQLSVSALAFALAPDSLADRRALGEDLSYALWQAKVAAGQPGGVVSALPGPVPRRPPR
jgi:GGDEF domain-containing protein